MDESLSSLSEQEYRAYDLESYSSLKNLLKQDSSGNLKPDKSNFLYYKQNPFKGSSSSLLGTCIHHYLQGNKHLVAFSIVDKRKKEAYAKFESEFRELAGFDGIIVPASFQKTLDLVMQSFNQNEKAINLTQDLKTEVALIAEYKGLKYKGKLDGMGKNYILEIKSSSQATNAEKFKEEVAARNYDLQAAMYLHASGLAEHYFLVVNTTPPFAVNVYKTSKQTIVNGFTKLTAIASFYQKYIIDSEEQPEEIDYDEV